MSKKAIGVFEKDPGSGIWWVRYRVSGQLHREKVGRKSDATALYQKRKADIRAGIKLPANMRAKSMTFGTIADAALEWSKAHKRDWKNDDLRIPTLKAKFGSREADSIRPEEIDAYVSVHAKAPATQNRLLALFSMIYREALINKKVSGNPARSVPFREVDNARIRYITDPEEKTLTDIIKRDFPHHVEAFTIAIHTGMRLGEQFTLEWPQVNLDRKMIHLPRTKNGRERYIPLNSTALDAFKRIRARVPADTVPVFLTKRKEKATGCKARIKTPRTWFEDVVEESKLTGITWHTCRHTFISRLVMAGVDLRTVMELAGHKSMTMTLRYSHLAPAHTASAVERIAKAPAKVSPQVSPRKKATRKRVA
ncbi:MAG: tyrosine-type recombinase/integrase [Acidobacteriaceae bacterium]